MPNKSKTIDWDSVPDANASANTGIDWDSVPSAVTGEISPVAPPKDAQESVQRWFGDVTEDVRHGTGRTLPGRILRGMGAPGTEAGAGGGQGGVGDIMGGAVLGPPEMAHALTSTRPEDTTQQRVRQANELFRGFGHTIALPAAALGGPEVIPSLGIYGAAGSGVSHAASAFGANPEEAELAGNVAMTAAPLIKYPVGPALGRGLQKYSGPLGKVAGYGAAAAELYHTRNPLSLLFGHPRATRAATGLIDMAGRGLQYFGGPPELGPLPPAMRMPNAEAQNAQTFGRQVMGIKLPGPGEVRMGPTGAPPVEPTGPRRLGKGAIITPPPPGSVPVEPPPEPMPGSMEGRPSTTPPTPKPRGRARKMSNLPPFYGLPQAPPPVYQPEAQQETVHPQEEPVPPLITTWGAPSTTPKALSEAVPPAEAPVVGAPPAPPETPPLINTQPLTKVPEKPIISQEAKPDMPETPPSGNISRRGLFGMIRGGKAPEAPPEPPPVETGPDHEAMMGVAQQAIQKLYPDNPDQMMNAHVQDQNLQEGQWDAHDLLTDVLHGYMDAIARTDPESTVRQHMIWTLKKSLPLFEQAGAMGDPESAKAYQEGLPTPEKLDEYFKNINEPPPGPRAVSRAPKPTGKVPMNYPDEPGLIGPQSQEAPPPGAAENLGTAITQAVNKPVSRRDFLQKGAKAAASTMVPKGVAGNLIQSALSGQLPTSIPEAAGKVTSSLAPAAIGSIVQQLWKRLDLSGDDDIDYNGGYLDEIGEALAAYSKAKGITGSTTASWSDIQKHYKSPYANEDDFDEDTEGVGSLSGEMSDRVRDILKDSGIEFDDNGATFDPKNIHLLHDISHLVGESFNFIDGTADDYATNPKLAESVSESINNILPKINQREALGWSNPSHEEAYQKWREKQAAEKPAEEAEPAEEPVAEEPVAAAEGETAVAESEAAPLIRTGGAVKSITKAIEEPPPPEGGSQFSIDDSHDEYGDRTRTYTSPDGVKITIKGNDPDFSPYKALYVIHDKDIVVPKGKTLSADLFRQIGKDIAALDGGDLTIAKPSAKYKPIMAELVESGDFKTEKFAKNYYYFNRPPGTEYKPGALPVPPEPEEPEGPRTPPKPYIPTPEELARVDTGKTEKQVPPGGIKPGSKQLNMPVKNVKEGDVSLTEPTTMYHRSNNPNLINTGLDPKVSPFIMQEEDIHPPHYKGTYLTPHPIITEGFGDILHRVDLPRGSVMREDPVLPWVMGPRAAKRFPELKGALKEGTPLSQIFRSGRIPSGAVNTIEDLIDTKGFQERGRQSHEEGESAIREGRYGDELEPWAQHPYGSYEPPGEPNVPEVKPLIETGKAEPYEEGEESKPQSEAISGPRDEEEPSKPPKPLIETESLDRFTDDPMYKRAAALFDDDYTASQVAKELGIASGKSRSYQNEWVNRQDRAAALASEEEELPPRSKASVSAPRSIAPFTRKGGPPEPYKPPFEEGPDEEIFSGAGGIGNIVDELIKYEKKNSPDKETLNEYDRMFGDNLTSEELSKAKEDFAKKLSTFKNPDRIDKAFASNWSMGEIFHASGDEMKGYFGMTAKEAEALEKIEENMAMKEESTQEKLDPNSLISTQDFLDQSIVDKADKNNLSPLVYRIQGKNYIIDGHHRVANARLKGNPILAQVLDYDKFKEQALNESSSRKRNR